MLPFYKWDILVDILRRHYDCSSIGLNRPKFICRSCIYLFSVSFKPLQISFLNTLLFIFITNKITIAWEPPWSKDNVAASHPASPVQILVGSVSCWGFFRGFPCTARRMLENLGQICPRIPFGHLIHPNYSESVYGRRRSLASAIIHGRR